MNYTLIKNNNECISVVLGKIIGSGSNSKIYNVLKINENTQKEALAKCSINKENYVSFNLQRKSIEKCHQTPCSSIVIPQILSYGKSKEFGEVLIMKKISNLHDIHFIINHNLYYGDILIKELAKAIAYLHNNNISGYDTEFYWEAESKKIAILDVGPLNTIGVNSTQMLQKHWNIESENIVGRWNIVSQIIPCYMAKEMYKTNKLLEIDLNYVAQYLDNRTMDLHIRNTARIHALSTFGRLNIDNKDRYLNMFIKEYKKNLKKTNIDYFRYIKYFEDAILADLREAKATLYYSNVEPLCEMSCKVIID